MALVPYAEQAFPPRRNHSGWDLAPFRGRARSQPLYARARTYAPGPRASRWRGGDLSARIWPTVFARCAAKLRDGQPCGRTVSPGSEFCSHHASLVEVRGTDALKEGLPRRRASAKSKPPKVVTANGQAEVGTGTHRLLVRAKRRGAPSPSKPIGRRGLLAGAPGSRTAPSSRRTRVRATGVSSHSSSSGSTRRPGRPAWADQHACRGRRSRRPSRLTSTSNRGLGVAVLSFRSVLAERRKCLSGRHAPPIPHQASSSFASYVD
jgi:hypothetical protein